MSHGEELEELSYVGKLEWINAAFLPTLATISVCSFSVLVSLLNTNLTSARNPSLSHSCSSHVGDGRVG